MIDDGFWISLVMGKVQKYDISILEINVWSFHVYLIYFIGLYSTYLCDECCQD